MNFLPPIFATAVGAIGTSTNALETIAVPASGATAMAVVRMAGSLALVLGLFFAGLWVFRNWQRLACRSGRVAKLGIYETKSLGPRHSLHVIGYEDQRLLVAVSPAGMSLLANLPPAQPVTEAAVSQSEPVSTLPSNFAALFLNAVTRKS